jgi:hypothetical protein
MGKTPENTKKTDSTKLSRIYSTSETSNVIQVNVKTIFGVAIFKIHSSSIGKLHEKHFNFRKYTKTFRFQQNSLESIFVIPDRCDSRRGRGPGREDRGQAVP